MTVQKTLTRLETHQFSEFLKKHNREQFFFAKDQGAYIGATAGSREDDTFENILFYFEGCDPQKNEDWWETARMKFGGDDCGVFLDANIVHDAAFMDKSIQIKVGYDALTLSVVG